MDIGDPVFNTELEVDEIHDYINQVLKDRHGDTTFIHQSVYAEFSCYNTIEKIIELLGNASIYYDNGDNMFIYNWKTEEERWGKRDKNKRYFESTFVVRHDGLDDLEFDMCVMGVVDKLRKLDHDVELLDRDDRIVNGKMREVYRIYHRSNKNE